MKPFRTLAISAAVVALAVPAGAASVPTETPVKQSSDITEFQVALSSSYYVWDQAPLGSDRVQIYAQATSGGEPFRVNQGKTFGFMGGIDGSRLVFEEASREGSDLVMVDLATGTRTPLPPGVNTPKEEFEPVFEGDYVGFVRVKFGRRVKASMWLLQLSTGQLRQIDTRNHREFLLMFPGQLNGNFMTWMKCGGKPGAPCNSWRYDIAAGTKVQVPNPGGLLNYAPGVAADGTVYYGQSGFKCGQNAFMMKWTGSGDPTVVFDFPAKVDFNGTFVYDTVSPLEIHYGRAQCDQGTGDLYKLVE